jgi:hypothetical protein
MSLGRHTHGKDARVKRPSRVAGTDRPGRVSAGQLEKMIDSRTKNTLESERTNDRQQTANLVTRSQRSEAPRGLLLLRRAAAAAAA